MTANSHTARDYVDMGFVRRVQWWVPAQLSDKRADTQVTRFAANPENHVTISNHLAAGTSPASVSSLNGKRAVRPASETKQRVTDDIGIRLEPHTLTCY